MALSSDLDLKNVTFCDKMMLKIFFLIFSKSSSIYIYVE